MTHRFVRLLVSLSLGAMPMAAQTHQDSPMFRYNPAHTGVVVTGGLPELGRVSWTFQTDGTVRSTPALVDGVLYVGSSDGHLYALHATSGDLVWSYDAGSPVASSPAVAGGRVIFADRDNTIRAVHAASGTLAWRLDTGEDVDLPWGLEGWDYLGASPVLARIDGVDVIVIGSGNGVVYALNPANGRPQWQFDTGGRIRGTPAVASGLVFIGSATGIVYALELQTGAVRWRHETSGTDFVSEEFGFDRRQVQASAAVHDNVVYIGSRDASLYALDAATGDVLWHREDGSAWVVSSAAVRGSRLYNGRSSGGMFRAVDIEDGAEHWVVSTGGPVFSSPTLVGNVVYVGSASGRLFAIDADTGTVRWRLQAGGPIYSSPVVSNGSLYFGSDDGKVYALTADTDADPDRAVYYEPSLRSQSAWGSADAHREAVSYFQRNGYRLIDGDGLKRFLEQHANGGTRSVVVMGMDALPSAVANSASDTALVRAYLRSGGKVVWMGYPPFSMVRDDEGGVTALDRPGASLFTGADLSVWNTDSYFARPTPYGERWGLSSWGTAGPVATPEGVDIALAMDEMGHATAWVKRFSTHPGTGFVYVPATTKESRLDEIRRVAEYGLMENDTKPAR